MIRLIDGNNMFKRYFHTLGTGSLQTLYLDSISQNPNLLKIIWVWDGFNANKRRKDIYPAYKGNRQPSSEEFYKTRDLFKELLTYSNCLTLEIPTYEADDVIAKIALSTKGEVEIVSTDQDFHSLEKEDLVLVTDYPSSIPKDKMKMYKVLVGDKSDNIPGLRGFGIKSWEALSESQLTLFKRFIEGTDVLSAAEVSLHIGLTKKLIKTFLNCAEDLRVFFEVISFFDVPSSLISKHLKSGSLNEQKVHEILFNQLLF